MTTYRTHCACGRKLATPTWKTCQECTKGYVPRERRHKPKPLSEKVVIKISDRPDNFGEFNWDYRPEVNYKESKYLKFYPGEHIKEEIERCESPISTYVVDNLGVVIGYRVLR